MNRVTPPPWAYDYSYTDAITTVDSVPKTNIEYPSYYCNDGVSTKAEDCTTQTFIDTIPLSFGKYKGKTPRELLTIAPDYIVWCEENLESYRCTWSEDLFEQCKEAVAKVATLRRRR